MIFNNITIGISIISMLFNIALFPTPFDGNGDEGTRNDDNRIVSAYCQDDKMYTYMHFSDERTEDVIYESAYASCFEEEYTANAVKLDGLFYNSTYVFLVNMDSNEEPERYKECVYELISDIYSESESVNGISYSIVLAGDTSETYDVVSSGDIDSVFETFEASDCNSDMYACLEEIYSQYAERGDGEFVNIIIITDGHSECFDDEAAINGDENAVAGLIEMHPETLVSVVCFSEDGYNEKLDLIMESALGYVESIEYSKIDVANTIAIAKNAQLLVDFNKNLYVGSFNIGPVMDSFELKLTVDDEEFIIKNVTDLNKQDMDENPDDTINPDDSGEALPDVMGNGSGDTVSTDNVSTNNSGSKKAGLDSEDDVDSTRTIILIALSVALAIVIILLILVLSKKSKKNGSIYEFERVNGNCVANGKLNKKDEITIGSSEQCRIVCKDSGVAGIHAKIYMKNDDVFIEDMDSPNGTYLEGMRIQRTNRVDSGDLLSVGGCEFILRFEK